MSQELLAFFYGQAIFRHCGADEGDTEDKPKESTEDEDEDGSEKDEKGKPKPRDPREAERNRKEAENRKRFRELEKERDKLKGEKEALELKDASELTKAQAELKKREESAAKRDVALKKTAVENAALKTKILVDKKPVEWVDIDDVLAHLHSSSDVEVDEDGAVSGVEEVLKKLAKAKPHWVKAAVVNDGKPTGVNSGNGSGGSLTADKQKTAELMRKYPGLRR